MKRHINMCIFMFMLPFLQLMFDTFFFDNYLLKKLRFGSFNLNFQNFVGWGICMQNTSCELCICNCDPMVFNFEQFSQILLELFQMILCQTLIVSAILGKENFYWKVVIIKIIKNIK